MRQLTIYFSVKKWASRPVFFFRREVGELPVFFFFREQCSEFRSCTTRRRPVTQYDTLILLALHLDIGK